MVQSHLVQTSATCSHITPWGQDGNSPLTLTPLSAGNSWPRQNIGAMISKCFIAIKTTVGIVSIRHF